MAAFKVFKQRDSTDCGPASLCMIAMHYGKNLSLEYIRDHCFITKQGVNLLGISDAAERIGFRTLSVKVLPEKLAADAPLPCILHWNQDHFVVLYKIKKSTFFIADPGYGLLEFSRKDFLRNWLGESNEGIALLLEPTQNFHQSDFGEPKNTKSNTGFGFLFRYLTPYRRYVTQLFICMLAGSGLSFILPFLTQVLVDRGIGQKNINYVNLVLISQFVLFFGVVSIELVRSWLLLYINSRINLSIISDFLIKLMRLPISFFDSKLVGDIKQRIADHNRIQSFLTGSSISTLFSLINIVVLTGVLACYSWKVLAIYMTCTALSFLWISLFLKRRKALDYDRFKRMGENENVLVELITGMQEIKMNNCETPKRWEWERVQAKLYKLSIQSLKLGQTQRIGTSVFDQAKNILISYIAAREVISGHMTLGMMMSISFVIGQLNSPFQLLLGFIQSAQDARISLDRLSEIHKKDDEDTPAQQQSLSLLSITESGGINYSSLLDGEQEPLTGSLWADKRPHREQAITLTGVSYQYTGEHSPFVLKDLSFSIPEGKVTAIVGESGSGKTTLMKLLLKFYEPVAGQIAVNKTDLRNIPPRQWRNRCGIVMQDGFIFSDTIAANIGMSDLKIAPYKLREACDIANIREFIEELPLNYNTKIGASGIGISAGQRQRILIARAVYKNPDYLFFDEATSALDANNEKVIIENLNSFFKGRTVVVIAHRLSTVKNADQIIVLDNSKVAEVGTHESLISSKGQYFELVKNQLQLSI